MITIDAEKQAVLSSTDVFLQSVGVGCGGD
mgnify:FL=1